MKQTNKTADVRALVAALRAARDPYPTTWSKRDWHVRHVNSNQRIDKLARAARGTC